LNLGPSSTAISKIWQDREKWANFKDSNKMQRVRGARWPELEKALVLWITQVQSCFHYFDHVSCWFVNCTNVAVAHLIKTFITFILQVDVRVSAMALKNAEC
jgi:hypothetical protein